MIQIERTIFQFEREKWQAAIATRQLERGAELSRRTWEVQRADEERTEREQRYAECIDGEKIRNVKNVCS